MNASYHVPSAPHLLGANDPIHLDIMTFIFLIWCFVTYYLHLLNKIEEFAFVFYYLRLDRINSLTFELNSFFYSFISTFKPQNTPNIIISCTS